LSKWHIDLKGGGYERCTKSNGSYSSIWAESPKICYDILRWQPISATIENIACDKNAVHWKVLSSKSILQINELINLITICQAGEINISQQVKINVY